MKLSKQTKLDLFNAIKQQKDFYGHSDKQDGLLNFLNDIWDLRAMPSEDDRFQDAYGDIFQHIVNNADWDFDYLFIERLMLLENDEYFNSFVETLLKPKYRKNEDEIIKFVLLINPFVEKDGYKLSISEYSSDGLPIYTLQLKEKVDLLPIDIKQNNIPFFVAKQISGRSDRASSHTPPSITPSFVLAFNKGWNDYRHKTEFSLFYYPENDLCHSIGGIKIMADNDELNTSLSISDEFTILNDDFCSLGQEKSYYSRLKHYLNKDFESILFALKDAAFFPEIQEKFEKNGKFTASLIRDDNVERLLRVIKYELYGYDLSNLYKFTFIFQPLFAENPIRIDFDFNNDLSLPNRIYALIGKNGTGKTQLITSLPIKISGKNDDSFSPRAPLFSKVIAVSYSAFDKFEIPKRTASFNYVYCGLRNEKDEELTDRGLVLRFHNTWKKIEKIERINQWRNILLNFIDRDIIGEFLTKKENEKITSIRNEYEVNIEGFNKVKNRLSSGQSIILYIISEIVANIRLDSLLLYDEPETHLHPNAITELMNTIYELVNEFESYCIIATHSPLVIRELLSRNVFVMERVGNNPSIRRIGLESFGENISTLTEEVFGNKEVPKQYKKIIQEFVSEGKSFNEIISLLEFDEMPLSLNIRIYIKSLIKQQNEES